eukprot:352785-Chlamydomonas_euryale.AAC.6
MDMATTNAVAEMALRPITPCHRDRSMHKRAGGQGSCCLRTLFVNDALHPFGIISHELTDTGPLYGM